VQSVSVDSGQLVQNLLNGMMWGTGFAIPFFVGITWAILKILSHPTVRSIARAADKLSGKGGGGLADVGVKILEGLAGGLIGGKGGSG